MNTTSAKASASAAPSASTDAFVIKPASTEPESKVAPLPERADDFDHMDLPFPILEGIYSYGFEKPSEVQARTIIPLTSGRDVVAQSQSGTGKTGAFVISTMTVVYRNKQQDIKDFLKRYPEATEKDFITEPTAIIMSNTQQLAHQTYNVFCEMFGPKTGITAELCIGSAVAVRQNIGNIKQGKVDVIIGTPGRILDLMECRKVFDPRKLDLIIVDEVDVMVGGSFAYSLESLFRAARPNVVKGLFSATISDQAKLITDKITRDPIRIYLPRSDELLKGIHQNKLKTIQDGIPTVNVKCMALAQILELSSSPQTIVYVSTQRRAVTLKEKLEELLPDTRIGAVFATKSDGSGMSSDTRETTLADFRACKIRVLISTDITARGFDAQQVKLVVNFDMPNSDGHEEVGVSQTYLHRIGRCGRWGRKGIAISFIGSKGDEFTLSQIENYFDFKIPVLQKDAFK